VSVPNDRAAFAYVGAFVEELVRAGVHHACIAPGSRSAPLAFMMVKHATLRSWMFVDERSAAFFALGLSRSLGEPVALLCTSGTAAANFFPAVVEAGISGVPVIVLTADRPPELRDVGAAQTIDQNRLYGAHAKWFVEVAIPDPAPEMMRYARTLAARAVARATASPAGPVHLNFPFREPLVPVPGADAPSLDPDAGRVARGKDRSSPWVKVARSSLRADGGTVAGIAERLRRAVRPLFVCGPQHDADLPPVLSSLASVVGAPVLADPLSQARWGSHNRDAVIDGYDSLLRDEATASSLSPDLVLRIGGVPTSKALTQFLTRHSEAPLIVVDGARWSDPSLLADEMVHADPRSLAEDLLASLSTTSKAGRDPGGWVKRWRDLNAAARSALAEHSSSLDEHFEGRALADVVACLPSGAALFVSSSMPVRDLDAFGAGDERSIRVFANRGANGIDGVVSTAMGAAAGARERGDGPLVLVIGDLAFYHDMNGLLAARLHSLDATVVVINNDGGGIFSFLPQADHPEFFEKLFGTPHGLDFAHAAALYEAAFSRAENSDAFRASLTKGIKGKGLHIIEVRTNRARNVELHREAWARVASAVQGLLAAD
jgi:2-succinyl-5-enolpyruvyl-6-hydroxy-3-cyclohexene-1-carboxylate synthase